MRQASRCLMMGLLIAGAAWAGDAAAASNTLKGISYDTLPGGRVELHLNFAGGPPPQPRIFTTGNPPRIAVDFADTSNAAPRHLDIGKGSTSGVSAIAAGGRTRVVVELMRDASYRTRVDGNDLVLTVNNGSDAQTVTTAATIDPTKALPSAMNGPSVSGIDFRRGPNGEGRVLINFSGSGADVDMRREGDKLIVNLSHVSLPASQAQRLDVLDFATPVQLITTHAGASGARMEVAIKGNVETSAYQTDNQYVLEVAPKKAAPTDGRLAKGQEPVYTGNRATFNFQDIPVRSVLQLLADYSGQNLVASDSVQGNITLRLSNVPWDQVLDVILRAKGLDKRRNGNVIWIAPQQELAAYEENVAQARLKAEDTAELITDYVPISYGKAADIAKLLTTGSMQGGGGGGSGGGGGAAGANRGFLSARGSVSYDERTNTLLVNDTPDKIKDLRTLIGVLDKPVQQVLIESRIVVATDDFTRELGVKWGVQATQTTSGGHVISTSPNGGAGGAADLGINTSNVQNKYAQDLRDWVAGGQQGPQPRPGAITYQTGSGGFNVNLPAASPAGSFGLAILGANYLVDLELSAAQTEGRGEVISSPRVITANQQEAVIRQGQEIGYVTFQNSSSGAAGSGTATVQFKDAVLELRVTPTITADNRVYLKINVKKDALAGYVDAPGSGRIPTIDTREVNTSALVDNGQTVVLGGIYEITKANTITKVPGLGDIPGLGALFRKTSRNNSKAELLIFVTPRILSETLQ